MSVHAKYTPSRITKIKTCGSGSKLCVACVWHQDEEATEVTTKTKGQDKLYFLSCARWNLQYM